MFWWDFTSLTVWFEKMTNRIKACFLSISLPSLCLSGLSRLLPDTMVKGPMIQAGKRKGPQLGKNNAKSERVRDCEKSWNMFYYWKPHKERYLLYSVKYRLLQEQSKRPQLPWGWEVLIHAHHTARSAELIARQQAEWHGVLQPCLAL